jgi:hypothetical protein
MALPIDRKTNANREMELFAPGDLVGHLSIYEQKLEGQIFPHQADPYIGISRKCPKDADAIDP